MKTIQRHVGVTFPHGGWFWFGVVAVTLGVLLHIPMFLHGQHNGYRLVGMPMDSGMLIGMGSIVIGLIATLYGLYSGEMMHPKARGNIQVEMMDNVRLGRAHFGLLITMAIAVTIDIMKPTALAFVLPGMSQEYNLKSPLNPTGSLSVAFIALAGISGTVIGSVLWGWLGDAIGRRSSIIFAGINFIATSICGAMPDFYWNLAMCFLMGLAVGGMVPIAYALLAETIPKKHRGWLMILVGADIAGAYVITSWLASELIPIYSWRILWLIGLPTGVAFVLLNRWIPESPRFLIAAGREQEAREVMARFGATIRWVPEHELAGGIRAESAERGWRGLIASNRLGITLAMSVLGIGCGLVLFGFNLWIPTNLRKLGFADADSILRNSALTGLPWTVVVALLYGFWSSKKTLLALAAVTSLSLGMFIVMGDAIGHDRTLLYLLLVGPIWGINTVVAVLAVYTSEIYPTSVRSKGAGLSAAACKAGGVLMILLVTLNIALPSMPTVALIGGLSMAIAVCGLAKFGVETRNSALEDIMAFGRQRAPRGTGTSPVSH